MIERPTVLREYVADAVKAAPAYDVHTNLFDPRFGELFLCGIDDLLIHHYLISEAFRWMDTAYQKFWGLTKARQAEVIWNQLFLSHSPVSEACRGVVTTLNQLGFEVKKRDLSAIRQHYSTMNQEEYVGKIFKLANVKKLCMANSPFDPDEREVWEKKAERDPRFVSTLRIESLLIDWEETAPKMRAHGYDVSPELTGQTFGEIRRFLADWTRKIAPVYCVAFLPPAFSFPDNSTKGRILEHAVLPHCRDHNQPFAIVLGGRQNVNPQLKRGGDSFGAADISAVERLCSTFPRNKFLCSALAQENQQALCVAARKFRNLHLFGSGRYLSAQSFATHGIRMKLDLIGLSFTAEHSGAFVLDQLIYKWRNAREIVAEALSEKYFELIRSGWQASNADVQRDAQDLLGGAFEAFLAA